MLYRSGKYFRKETCMKDPVKRSIGFLNLVWIAFAMLVLIPHTLYATDAMKLVVTDDAGRTVGFPNTPGRIVSLSPANTEILYAIGAGKNVVGVTEYCNYPKDALTVKKVGGFSDISVEKVVQLKPDVVFASNLHIAKIVPALERLRLTVVVIDPVKVASVFDSITLAGKILGLDAETKKLVTGMRGKYDALAAKAAGAEKVPLFWELSDDLWTVGKGSFIDDLLTEAGGRNIASSLDAPWLQLSGEFIIVSNPRVIFLADFPYGTNYEGVKKRPGWGTVSAVKSKNVVEVTSPENDVVSRPGPRVVEALEYVMKRLHPDLFD